MKWGGVLSGDPRAQSSPPSAFPAPELHALSPMQPGMTGWSRIKQMDVDLSLSVMDMQTRALPAQFPNSLCLPWESRASLL